MQGTVARARETADAPDAPRAARRRLRMADLAALGLLLISASAQAQTLEIGRANMFRCPEAIASPEARIWALAAWMRYTLDRNPAANDSAVMKDLRQRFLVAHHCAAALRGHVAAESLTGLATGSGQASVPPG